MVNCYQTLYAQRIAQMYQLNSSSGYINTFTYQTNNIDLYANLDYIIKQCKCQTTGNTKISKKTAGQNSAADVKFTQAKLRFF